jgi:hypothetical protein
VSPSNVCRSSLEGLTEMSLSLSVEAAELKSLWSCVLDVLSGGLGLHAQTPVAVDTAVGGTYEKPYKVCYSTP